MSFAARSFAVLLLLTTTACGEEGENGEIEIPADLAARATVTVDQARTTALARVPGGKVVSGSLEEEGGKLLWSFDIKVEGQDGIEEVQVDATSGTVLSQAHETEAQEAAEGDEGKEGDEADEAAESASAVAPGQLEVTAPGLLERTRITDEAARAIAIAKVGGGQVVGAELEEEGGRLIYSYDIQIAGKSGTEEVQVDAITGAVVSVTHEAPSDTTRAP